MSTPLPPVVAAYFNAVNAFDEEGIMETFAQDGLVNDARHEFSGIEAIRKWVVREFLDDHVTVEVTEVIDHRTMTVARGRYDGDFDKAELPDELILTNYFQIEAGKIAALIIIHNEPALY
jgi:hypothetical protein